MPIATLGDLHLYYELHGEGPDVLLVHGGFSRGDAEWGELIPRLDGFRAIVPDLRGHGRSDNPDPILDRVKAGVELGDLLDRLGVTRARVVGFSMGGHCSLALALARPELVERLVLIGPVMRLDERTTRLFRAAHPDRRADAGDAWAVALRGLHSPERWRALMASLGDGVDGHPNWRPEQLEQVACPTLVICGDRDYYGAPTRQAEQMAAMIPGARLLVLPGPHSVHRSDQGGQGGAVADAIAEFLRR